MPILCLTKRVLRIVAIPFALYLILVIVRLLGATVDALFPNPRFTSYQADSVVGGKRTIGYCREVAKLPHGLVDDARKRRSSCGPRLRLSCMSDQDFSLRALSTLDTAFVKEILP